MASPESTADSLLDAAELLFARQGYAATTIKQIGELAGANPALLYYHHGHKEQLYQAVLARVFGAIAQGASGRFDAATSPPETIRRIVAMQADLFSARPHGARLVLRELVDHEAEHAVELVARFANEVFARLCAVIRAGQEQGLFRTELQPEFAAVSTVSQMVYLVVARPMLATALGGSAFARDDAGLHAFADHAADFALAALSVPRSPPQPPLAAVMP